MEVIGGLRGKAPVADEARLAGSVGGSRLGSSAADHGHASLYDRFSPHPKLHAAEIEPGIERSLTEAHGGTRERQEMWYASLPQDLLHPLDNRKRALQRDVLRTG
jgi:hypothetical protein